MLSDPWKWVIEASHSQRERCQKSLSLKLGKKCSTIVETLKEMSRLRVQLEKHCNKIFNSGPRCQGNSLIPNLGHTEILCIIWDQLYHSDSQTRTVTVKGKDIKVFLVGRKKVMQLRMIKMRKKRNHHKWKSCSIMSNSLNEICQKKFIRG